ncbi:MAG: hypothetical protein QF672_09190 [SAR202 cluster bacterium]|nr:hypothetical protein [SAR202 cluster bacterium]
MPNLLERTFTWLETYRPVVVLAPAVLVVVVVLLVMVRLEYVQTGFAGKTIWDWMQVVAVPVVGIIVAGWFVIVAQGVGRRNALERDMANERERQDVLQSYLQQMKQLVLGDQLLVASDNAAAKAVASALTFAALRRLDGTRKGVVIRFLHESELIRKENPVISLNLADLAMRC